MIFKILKKKQTKCQRKEWYAIRNNQIAAFFFLSQTNQTAALGYESRTTYQPGVCLHNLEWCPSSQEIRVPG